MIPQLFHHILKGQENTSTSQVSCVVRFPSFRMMILPWIWHQDWIQGIALRPPCCFIGQRSLACHPRGSIDGSSQGIAIICIPGRCWAQWIGFRKKIYRKGNHWFSHRKSWGFLVNVPTNPLSPAKDGFLRWLVSSVGNVGKVLFSSLIHPRCFRMRLKFALSISVLEGFWRS